MWISPAGATRRSGGSTCRWSNTHRFEWAGWGQRRLTRLPPLSHDSAPKSEPLAKRFSETGLKVSSIGMLPPNTAENLSSNGLNHSYTGLQHSDIAPSHSDNGLEPPDTGTDQPNVGTKHSNVGLASRSVGDEHSSIGLKRSSIGILVRSIGPNRSCNGKGRSEIGMTFSHVGLKQSNVVMLCSDVGKWFSDTGNILRLPENPMKLKDLSQNTLPAGFYLRSRPENLFQWIWNGLYATMNGVNSNRGKIPSASGAAMTGAEFCGKINPSTTGGIWERNDQCACGIPGIPGCIRKAVLLPAAPGRISAPC